MNDIADTSVRIQTSAQVVSFRREQDGRSFFRALMLCSESEQRSSCGAEQRRNAQSFVFTHEHEIQRRDLAASPFSHHPTIDKECFL